LLTFISRSPDRCWVAFAPRALREGSPRMLTHFAQHDSAVDLLYTDDGTSQLHVEPEGKASVQIECSTTLPAAFYSHLNTYSEILVAGHSHLFIAFSPCPERRIEVVRSDYPGGRPARLAYRDRLDRFH